MPRPELADPELANRLSERVAAIAETVEPGVRDLHDGVEALAQIPRRRARDLESGTKRGGLRNLPRGGTGVDVDIPGVRVGPFALDELLDANAGLQEILEALQVPT